MPNLGNINIVYQGDLGDQGDTSSSPSPNGMYGYLLSKGATKGEAMMLTGAAASESDFDPTAVHDHGVGYGMFGHNGSRLLAMKQYAAQTGQPLSDWRTQAGFALNELRSRPEGAAAANATSPEQLALAQMHYEQPQGFTSSDPTQGHNYLGRLNTLKKFTALDPNATGAFAPSENPQVAPSQVAPAGASSAPVAGGNIPGVSPLVGSNGGVPANAFSDVGNPQLNAALARIIAQSQQQPSAQQPLVAQLIGGVTRPVHQALSSGLQSLLGGGGTSGGQPSFGAIPTSPSAPAPQPIPGPPPVDQPAVPSDASSLSGNAPMPVPRPADLAQPQPAVDDQQGPLPLFAQSSSPLAALGSLFGAS